MTRRIAEALLRHTARRWPRDYLGEWMAELAVLAAERKPFAMLVYAASLVRSRPAVRAATASFPRERISLMNAKTWATAAVAVAAPFVMMLLSVFSFLGAAIDGLAQNIFPGYRPDLVMGGAWTALIALIMAGLVAGAATWLGHHSVLAGPFRTAVVLLIPLTAGLLYAEFDLQRSYSEQSVTSAGEPYLRTSLVGAIVFWAAGLALVTMAAARLRSRKRAWTAGVTGALLVLDLTVMVPNLRLAASVGDLSPLTWLPASFVGSAPVEWNDNFSVYMMICSGYVVGYLIGQARRRPAPLAAADTEALQHAV